MKAHCLTFANPFDPIGSRAERVIRRPQRVCALAPKRGPVVATLNGRPILRATWRRRLRDGDVLVFARLPAGGQTGGGQSNPARTLMSIALMAFAPAIGEAVFGGIGGSIFGLSAAKLGSVAVVLAGSAAINALFPVPTARALPSPSPTYSIDAQGNSARIGQVVPVQYGRLLVYPDFAAQPYTEYSGDDQFVYQLLCLGAGSYSIEDIRIQDTPITSFSEIETEIITPGGQVTLFPTSVVTSSEVSGQELLGLFTATWSNSGGTVTFAQTAHGRASGDAVRIAPTVGTLTTNVYEITGIPDADHFTVTVPGTVSGTGTANIFSVIGGVNGFVASAAATQAHYLGLDLVLPLGLYDTAGDGTLATKSLSVSAEAQLVDDDGNPLGAWADLASITITDRTNTPLRRSFRYAVSAGRYRVRAWRTDVKSTSTTAGHQVLWSGLRSYMAEVTSWPWVTLIAMRMKATNNLSLQSSRQVAVLCTRNLPIWNGTSWSAETATRSIAWAIADAARNSYYGPALPDRELDLSALLALDALWSGRGDFFDGRFDQAGTWWDSIQATARAGRAQCFRQGGILRTVRDGPLTVPTAMFSERNMKPDSFSIDYVMQTDDTADVIKASYFDGATWSQQTVSCSLPDSTSSKAQTVPFFGITSRDQATREGTFLAAVNRRRRRVAKFTTEMEGRLPVMGELIAIQQSTLGWGQQAEARDWNAGARRLTVSEPLQWTIGATHFVALRRPDGSTWGPGEVTQGTTAYDLILADSPDFTPETGAERVRTHIAFGHDDTWAARAKVAMVTPRSLVEYDIQAVIEDPDVHVADEGLSIPPVIYSQLPGVITQPTVTGLIARRVPGSAEKALFTWNPAPNADSYQMDMAEGSDPYADDVSWTRVADTTSNSYATDILYFAQTMIRLRAMGLAAGPYIYAAIGDLLPDFWLTDDTPFWLADTAPFWNN